VRDIDVRTCAVLCGAAFLALCSTDSPAKLAASSAALAPSCDPPGIPQSLTATNGGYCDRVRLTWSAANLATGYRIYRNTVNNGLGATQIATDTASPFDDFTAAADGTHPSDFQS